LVAHTATPEQAVEQREAQQVIQDCLSNLPADQRTTLVMFDLEDYSYQEVAEGMDVQLGTVKSRLSRARLAMRRCLDGKQELFVDVFRFNN